MARTGASTAVFRTVVTSISGATNAGAVLNTRYIYFITGASGVLTLPSAIGNTNVYTIKNTHTAAVALAASPTVDGFASYSIQPNEAIEVASTGSAWRII